MIKLILLHEMNPDRSEAYINPEDISSISDAGDGPTNEGQTIMLMKNQTSYQVSGYAQAIIKILVDNGEVELCKEKKE